jgi:hypothetical protein
LFETKCCEDRSVAKTGVLPKSRGVAARQRQVPHKLNQIAARPIRLSAPILSHVGDGNVTLLVDIVDAGEVARAKVRHERLVAWSALTLRT